MYTVDDYKAHSALTEDELLYLSAVTKEIPDGKIVIAGTYYGGDSALIINNCLNPVLILDSFEGLSEPHEFDGMDVKSGECAINHFTSFLETLGNFQCRNQGVNIHRMWITGDSLKEIKDEPVSLIWLDLDLYEPTKACLEKFLPHLVRGGICITHDYDFHRLPGVKKACDELGLIFERGMGGIWRMKGGTYVIN